MTAIEGMRGMGPYGVCKLFVPFPNLFLHQFRSDKAVGEDKHFEMAAVQGRFAQSRSIKSCNRPKLLHISPDLGVDRNTIQIDSPY